jgi:Cu(I)/Ag(I) efflux system membrane protein CusA/SilA
MLTKIIDWSSRNRFLVLLATLFVIFGGVVAVLRTPLDALPDLSDVQVIVYTEYPGQAPQVVEDQVTYPLTTAMLSVPKSKVVRGFSFFGASFVYVIFEDGTDIYWARSRVLEYLNFASGRMPRGVTPQIGPDATGVGWVYQYALLAKNKSLAELRTIQDWYLRYQLTKAHGVAEVASIGGFVQTYQVTVDPGRFARLRHPSDDGRPGHPRLQPGRRRPHRRNGRNRIHGARQGLPAGTERHRVAGSEERQGHAGVDS